MQKIKIWIGLIILVILVSGVFYYQKDQKDQFIQYLQDVDQAFSHLAPIQELSLEANKAGMTGDHKKEAEINQQLIKVSEDFIAGFDDIATHTKALQRIQEKLLKLNESTHQLLVVRVEILSKIKSQELAKEDAKEVVDDFWEMQEQNKDLYRDLIDALETQAKKYKVELTDYLKNL